MANVYTEIILNSIQKVKAKITMRKFHDKSQKKKDSKGWSILHQGPESNPDATQWGTINTEKAGLGGAGSRRGPEKAVGISTVVLDTFHTAVIDHFVRKLAQTHCWFCCCVLCTLRWLRKVRSMKSVVVDVWDEKGICPIFLWTTNCVCLLSLLMSLRVSKDKYIQSFLKDYFQDRVGHITT